jgi:hypothetical protein
VIEFLRASGQTGGQTVTLASFDERLLVAARALAIGLGPCELLQDLANRMEVMDDE